MTRGGGAPTRPGDRRAPCRPGGAVAGASQLLSRVLGVVREMVLAWQVGAGPDADAYRAAFQLPDLLNHFLAVGAIATAFIPLYHRARERGGAAAAERFFAGVWGTLTAGAVLATVLLSCWRRASSRSSSRTSLRRSSS